MVQSCTSLRRPTDFSEENETENENENENKQRLANALLE